MEQQPTRSIVETCRRIAAIIRVVRGSTRVSRFLKCLGLKWNAVVIAVAGQLGITTAVPAIPLTPDLNLIERPWKFTKRSAFLARQRPILTDFRAAVEQPLSAILTQHASYLSGACQDSL